MPRCLTGRPFSGGKTKNKTQTGLLDRLGFYYFFRRKCGMQMAVPIAIRPAIMKRMLRFRSPL